MNEKLKRNDPCPCGSGKKYKKCCGKEKKLSTREANVITSSGQGSLLDRIKSAGESANISSLKNRISKQINSSDAKKD